MSPATTERALTPAQVAARLAVSVHAILAWIAAGELQALNLARRRGGRPRWKILPEALAAFEAARMATTKPAPAKRRKASRDYVDYFG